MNKLSVLVFVLLALVASACGSVPVEYYCGKDATYSIQNYNGALYRLELHVGDVKDPHQVCSVAPHADRVINLAIDVPSIDEAHKVIDREQARYKEMMKSTVSSMEHPLLPANQK